MNTTIIIKDDNQKINNDGIWSYESYEGKKIDEIIYLFLKWKILTSASVRPPSFPKLESNEYHDGKPVAREHPAPINIAKCPARAWLASVIAFCFNFLKM